MGEDNLIPMHGVMKAVLRKKLEDKILELIDLPIGKTDRNILDYIRIVEENGFSDALLLLKEMVYEIGKAQIQKSRKPRKKRKQEERCLEDYLSKGDNLGKIEPGLKYKGRQRCLKTGRLDIYATDSEEREVIAELKMDNYVSKEVFWQLLKYMNEKEDHRFMFVAPHIKPDLFYPLKNYVDSGRLSFFDVERQGKEYSFRRIDENNIDSSGRRTLNLDTRKREPDVVTVVRGAKLFDAAAEWDSYPFYYQVMLFNRPELKNKKRYLKPIPITQEQKAELDRLLTTKDLDEVLSEKERLKSLFGSVDEAEESGKAGRLVLRNQKEDRICEKGHKRRNYYLDEFRKLDNYANRALCNAKINVDDRYSVMVELFREIQKELNSLLAKFRGDKDMRRFLGLLKACAKRDTVDNQEFAKGLFYFSVFNEEEMLNETLKLKLARHEALMEIDKELALTYLCFAPTTEEDMKSLKEGKQPDYSKKLIIGSNYDFLERDRELYESILSNFYIGERPEEKAEEPAPEKEQSPAPPKKQDPHAKIVCAVSSDNTGIFTQDVRLRINYFAQDAIDIGLSGEEVNELCRSFSTFNLPRRMRNRETRPSEMQIRNFFDDVTIHHIRHDQVPQAKDLESMYRVIKR